MAPTARRRRPATADEEAPGSVRRRRPEPEEPVSRSPEAEEVEDEEEAEEVEQAPRRRRRSTGPSGPAGRRPKASPGKRSTQRSVATGWAGHKEVAKSSRSENVFQIEEEPHLLKMLQDQPFAAYRQHWIPARRRSFICLKKIDGDCPLCDDVGDVPNGSKTLFNVVDMNTPEKVLVWEAGATAAGELEDISEDERFEGLSDPKLYLEVYSKKRGDKPPEHKVNIIRSRDLPDDWDVDPLGEDELAELEEQVFDADFVHVPKPEDLEEVADELS